MNVEISPLSPVSLGDGESIGNIPKFPTPETESTYRNNWGQPASPPKSSSINGGFFMRSATNFNGNPGAPSPPSSIARSSGGVGFYSQSESGMSRKDDRLERTLLEHYSALNRYLSITLNDEKENPRPNRARDKLLRLSPVQFQELSTDVYDELVRRQQGSARRMGPGMGPPPYLLPKENFHPKRNQARQKLSTLPPPRFKDLATDVFYELERRLPTSFVDDDTGQIEDSNIPIGRAPRRLDLLANENSTRPPSETSSLAYSTKSESQNGLSPFSNNITPPFEPTMDDLNRPKLKSFQSNTIVPNKSTIVEDDETEGEYVEEENSEGGVAYGLKGAAKVENDDSEETRKLLESYIQQIKSSNELLNSMEEKLKLKDDELTNVVNTQQNKLSQMDREKKDLQELTVKLETKLADAQNLNESLKLELHRVKAAHTDTTKVLQAEIQELRFSLANSTRTESNSQLELENESLKEDLSKQQRLTEDVRIRVKEALREMRTLSEKSRLSSEKEEYLSNAIKRLEEEVKDWREKYVMAKTQLKTLRAPSNGLNTQPNAAAVTRDREFLDSDGMVKDVNIIKFQLSIDDLLRRSRIDDDFEKIMEMMKTVVLNARNIIQDVGETSPSRELTPRQKKLKFSVTVTAKNLITASKNFVAAKGLSPISLLDAAVSHLTSAVIELLRTVKIRPTPDIGLDDSQNEENPTPGGVNSDSISNEANSKNIDNQKDKFDAISFQGRSNFRLSGNSSMYSPTNSPRYSDSTSQFSPDKEAWNTHKTSASRTIRNDIGINNPLLPMGVAFGIRTQKSDVEQLKVYLEDQTSLLVKNVQSLVSAIRCESGISATVNSINAISDVVEKVIYSTENTMSAVENSELRTRGDSIVKNLTAVRKRLIEAGITGRQIADEARDDDEGENAWRNWNQSLPPIAFEIAREMKELVLRVDAMDIANENEQKDTSGDDDDFS